MFDVLIAPGIRLFNWQLKRTSTGGWTIYSPAAKGGSPTAMIDPDARARLVAAVQLELGGERIGPTRT
ncbi:hypothetical protein JP75_11580 [Devosia riboflavina]|uniref:Uncharacterized protein n=1 Tax=Devosia riboflavina TaxID=46914 RepID=A0A087M284_9HYPH|nr:hypothetical protein JP75_11580 [Devosia riboflavina]